MNTWLSLGLLVLGATGCDRMSPRAELKAESQPRAVAVAAGPGMTASESEGATPVVVELFSSEGCSSCPPADLVLQGLSSKQGIAGANVIALELHVDYWNDLGWADPFSSAAYSARQRDYSQAMGRRGAFTPEAIVNGRASVNGSDASALSAEVTQAAAQPHVRVALSARADGSLDATSSSVPGQAASYWLAITESGLVSEVKAGENRGQTLQHAPVVRSLDRVGPVTAAKTHIELPPVRSASGELTAVVFVQHDGDRAIVGANTLALTRGAGGG